MNLIVRNNFDISLLPTFKQHEAVILAQASLITAVECAADNEEAFKVCRVLKGWLRGIEDSRKAVKAPVLALEQKIDATAAEAAAELNAELARVNKLIGDWADKIDEEKRQIEAARQRELQALERVEQENQRKVHEAQAALQTCQNPQEAAGLIRQSWEAANDAQKASAQALEMRSNPIPLPQPALAEGQSLKHEWDYEDPTTQELAALFTLYGERFVKLEARRSELKYWLNSDLCPMKDNKPAVGLRLKRVSKQRFAGKKQQAALEG